MTFIRVFGEGTVSGTGGASLTSDSADSSTSVNAGDTLQFNTSARTTLEIDDSIAVDDIGQTGVVTTPTTIDGNSIDSSNNIELNYAFLTQDASGDLFTVWVFAYANSDADQFYLVSDAGTPTLDGSGDITTVTQTATDYAGQELTVLDASALAPGATTDPDLNEFMRGDGTLTFNPANNDLDSIFGLTTFTDPLPCFLRGTLILTDHGEVEIEKLKPNDLVMTNDHGFQPIRWIGSRSLTRAELKRSPQLRPIRIAAFALGNGLPAKDLLVSPQHRVLVRSTIARRMFGIEEVLLPANKLLPSEGVEVVDVSAEGAEYYHILFDQHETVFSNGALTESLFTGPEALRSISASARKEIETLFPEICQPDFEPVATRLIPKKGKAMKQLVERHLKNNKPFYSAV